MFFVCQLLIFYYFSFLSVHTFVLWFYKMGDEKYENNYLSQILYLSFGSFCGKISV